MNMLDDLEFEVTKLTLGPDDMLAVRPAAEAFALARVLLRIGREVDVVGLAAADLLQLEAGAEVGGHGREEVVGGVLADRDLDHAGVALERLEGQPDGPNGLDAAAGFRCSSHCSCATA